MKTEREDFIVIKEIQKKVEKKLTEMGVKVYFIAFEMDDGQPYFAYAFDESIVAEAKEDWEQGMMPMNCFDDYSFEDDFERIVNDICNIITQRSKTDE